MNLHHSDYISQKEKLSMAMIHEGGIGKDNRRFHHFSI